MMEKAAINNKYLSTYISKHYYFHYSENSLAAKDIESIADRQEKAYRQITVELNIFPDFKIDYLLADSPEDLGVIYGDNIPCNGFVRLPNKVYAVYNEQIKCIGMHEDVHIISFTVKKPKNNFIIEGLAMYFDGQWQGKSNIEICRQLLNADKLPDIIKLTDNEEFFILNESLSYPLAGAFTEFLIQKITIKRYLEDVYYNDDLAVSFNKIFGCTNDAITEFIKWLKTKS